VLRSTARCPRQGFLYVRSCKTDNEYSHPLDLCPLVDLNLGKVRREGCPPCVRVCVCDCRQRSMPGAACLLRVWPTLRAFGCLMLLLLPPLLPLLLPRVPAAGDPRGHARGARAHAAPHGQLPQGPRQGHDRFVVCGARVRAVT
jgi:hypothetical protein